MQRGVALKTERVMYVASSAKIMSLREFSSAPVTGSSKKNCTVTTEGVMQ